MNWQPVIIIGAVIAVFFVVKRLALVAPAKARECLKAGAKVIDVRSPGEFKQRHLPGAVNIPLDSLGDQIGRHAPDKNQPLLLHCLSGGRSGIAKSALKRMGYTQCFNLGSIGRAQKIVQDARTARE
jgi:phage shock protein E